MTSSIALLENARKVLAEIGDMTLFGKRYFKAVFTRPFEWEELLRQCYLVGNKSLLLVGVTGFILGLVIGTFDYLLFD